MPEYRNLPGTFDVLPPESAGWTSVLATFAKVVATAGYGLVITPTFEELGVFQRLGESTDVVRKEMYDFKDKGGRHLALRPEVTASVVRAFIQHRPTLPWKTWYAAANFRYERPQAGRQREFHQLGVEALGADDPDLDVEVVALGWDFYSALGLSAVDLAINSLGDAICRPGYRQLLFDYLSERKEDLCEEHRGRVEENPLRVLDCKRPACVGVTAEAPRQVDHLCGACRDHFARVQEGLEALGVPYRVESALVRGLDYYTRTTFEYAGRSLASAQNALGGGGRYDTLVAQMGGPDTPAIGFALGIERIVMALQAEQGRGRGSGTTLGAPCLDVFVVDLTDGSHARDLTHLLRRSGITADRAFGNRSAKSQFKAADRSRARLAVVVGPDEIDGAKAGIKDLSVAGAEQDTVSLADLVAELRRRLGKG